MHKWKDRSCGQKKNNSASLEERKRSHGTVGIFSILAKEVEEIVSYPSAYWISYSCKRAARPTRAPWQTSFPPINNTIIFLHYF